MAFREKGKKKKREPHVKRMVYYSFYQRESVTIVILNVGVCFVSLFVRFFFSLSVSFFLFFFLVKMLILQSRNVSRFLFLEMEVFIRKKEMEKSNFNFRGLNMDLVSVHFYHRAFFG